jgi:hypothetical protein
LDHDHHRVDYSIGHAADGERQHAPVFFEGSRPGSTEDVVLAPATGGDERVGAAEPVRLELTA